MFHRTCGPCSVLCSVLCGEWRTVSVWKLSILFIFIFLSVCNPFFFVICYAFLSFSTNFPYHPIFQVKFLSKSAVVFRHVRLWSRSSVFIDNTIAPGETMKRKSAETSQSHGHQPKKGFWALGLLSTMKDPKYVVKTDEKITIIKDMYPKAQHHYLVLPNEDISSLKSINKNHINLLQHMDTCAREYVNKNHPDSKFKFGYHAEASMHRLHLHAISDDMDSTCLKTKKHWNTFTTDFFLDSKDVIKSLEQNGKVQLPSQAKCKEYMNTPLKCHKCSVRPKNMPELKRHIITHLK